MLHNTKLQSHGTDEDLIYSITFFQWVTIVAERFYDNDFHCMKSGIFISMQYCRLTWNFRFATVCGNLQATPKIDGN